MVHNVGLGLVHCVFNLLNSLKLVWFLGLAVAFFSDNQRGIKSFIRGFLFLQLLEWFVV